MMRVADSSARSRIWAARARPSVSGMRASSSTSAYGRPDADGVPEGVHGRQPVAHRRRLHLPAAQPLLQDVAVGGVVVHDEHPQVVEQDRRPGGGLLRRVRLAPEPRREGEGAAPARLALHGDRPAHQGHQPGGDRQAQAGAAVLPRGRGVLLLEGPEDPLLLVGRDADAGVAHREAQRSTAPPSAAFAGDLRPRTTTSPSSVNLMALPTRLSSTCRSRPASPTRASGTSGCTWQTSSSPFLWARTARARRVSPDRRPQREVGRVQLQLAGLDLGEVEQVVDDAEQVVGRGLDRLQALPLVLGQRRVEGQLGHAEDGVHGGADLVADVGQELVLGPVGRLRRLLGLPQLLLGPLAVGDVRCSPERCESPLACPGMGRRDVVQPAVRPVAAADAVFHVVRLALATEAVQICRRGSRSSGCSSSIRCQPSSSLSGIAEMLRSTGVAEVVAGAVRRRDSRPMRVPRIRLRQPLLASRSASSARLRSVMSR